MLSPLLVRFGALGDMVILLAMVRALYLRFGQPVDVVSSGAWNRYVIQEQPGVGRLFLIRSRAMPYALSLDQQRLAAMLRERGAGPVWNCDASTRTTSLLSRAEIPVEHIVDGSRVGRHDGEHEVDRLLRLATMTPVGFEHEINPSRTELRLRVPPLVVHEQWRHETDTWLRAQGLDGRPLVLIQAGNKRTTKWWRPSDRPSNAKYWPEAKWAQVIDRLAALEPRAVFLLCGAPSEYVLNNAIARRVQTPRVRSLASDLPLPRLLALQERALGMISVDTGPAHSAGALDCPLVVLFGTQDPNIYLPRSESSPVTCVRGFEAGVASMRAISVNDVVEAWTGRTILCG